MSRLSIPTRIVLAALVVGAVTWAVIHYGAIELRQGGEDSSEAVLEQRIPSSGPILDQNCILASDLCGEDWYSWFVSSYATLGLASPADWLYLEDANSLIVLIEGKYCGHGFELIRFSIEEKTAEKAELGKAAAARGCLSTPTEIGSQVGQPWVMRGRGGDASCESVMEFEYNLTKNIFELTRECSMCDGEPPVCNDH
jgi:hypothetical protein